MKRIKIDNYVTILRFCLLITNFIRQIKSQVNQKNIKIGINKKYFIDLLNL